MSRSIVLIIALLASAGLVALGTYSFHEETARSKPVVLPFEVLWCGEDSDCAVVDRIGCCPCSEGGAQAAVTAWRRDELRRFLKKACERKQICVQLNLCRSDVEARCVDRHCTLVTTHGQ